MTSSLPIPAYIADDAQCVCLKKHRGCTGLYYHFCQCAESPDGWKRCVADFHVCVCRERHVLCSGRALCLSTGFHFCTCRYNADECKADVHVTREDNRVEDAPWRIRWSSDMLPTTPDKRVRQSH